MLCGILDRSRKLELTYPVHGGPSTSQRERLALPAPDFLRKVNGDTSTSLVCEPIIEEPASPPRQSEEELVDNQKKGAVPETNLHLCEVPSNALVIVPPDVAAQPVPKLKSVGRLRTVHYV